MTDLVHILEDDSMTLEDISIKANDYLRDTFEVKIDSVNVWYVGLYKPFRSFYVEVDNYNASTSSVDIEYFDGADWAAVHNKFDDTLNFARSGFVKFNFPDNSKITDSWIKNTIGGTELYWLKISSLNSLHGPLISVAGETNTINSFNIANEDISKYSVGQEIYIEAEDSYHTVTSITGVLGAYVVNIAPDLVAPIPDNENIYALLKMSGLNIVFANDNEMRSEVRNLDDFKFKSDNSFIAYHVSARDDIVQTIRNGGETKTVNSEMVNITKWDLLDIGEISQAAKYLALSKIFFDVSENNDDKSYQRYLDYTGKYGQAFKLWYKTIDFNNDGNISKGEVLTDTVISFNKV